MKFAYYLYVENEKHENLCILNINLIFMKLAYVLYVADVYWNMIMIYFR